MLLSGRDLTKAWSTDPLFESLNLNVDEQNRVGIIGPNGSGKSTLLRILAGLETSDAGEVILRRGVHRAYVPQQSFYAVGKTVWQIAEEAAVEHGVPDDDLGARISIWLGRAGFTDFEKEAETLSGGWKKRLSLACGLLGNPQLLLLDEPTNHLDMAGVLWLQGLLAAAPFAWILVTHDRYFLEQTAARVVELNRSLPDGLFQAEGGYQRFLEKKYEMIEAGERYREALSNKVKREAEWLRRSPKARTTKARFRVNEAGRLIEELDELKSRGRQSETRIDFNASERKTKKLVEVERLCKTIGDRKLVEDLDLVLSPGMRLGILGGNGTGKTTLLRLLAGELEPDSGRVKHAPFLKVVYFDQNRDQLDQNATLQHALCETGDTVVFRDRPIHIVSWASRFLFTRDQLPIPLHRLSGGEQARVLIARLMLKTADILLLDEPTNDLDIPTLEVLEESLMDFPGAVVLVTHDRFMLDRVCDRYVGLDGRGGCVPHADYAKWEQTLKQVDSEEKQQPKKVEKKTKTAQKKLSYMEQREMDGMEERILEAEERLETCREVAEDPAIASNAPKLIEAHEALEKAQKEVDTLYARWAELEARTQ